VAQTIRVLFWTFGVWAASLCSLLQAASLEEELTELLANHPQIQSNRHQVSSAEQGVSASFSAFLPSLNLTGEAGQEYISTPAVRSTPAGPSDAGAETWGVTLSQNVYDGGRKFVNRGVAKLSREVADYTLTNVTQAVTFEGIAAYLDVLRQSQLVNLSNQNEGNIRLQLNLEDERVRRGSGIAVDVLQAKSRLQLALERLVFVSGALRDAETRYFQVFARMPSLETMLIPAPPRRLLPETLDYAVAIALSENPTLRTTNKQIDLAMQNRESIEAEYYPNVDLVFEGGYEDDFNGVPGIRRDWALKLRANWNLFNGLNTRYRTGQAAFDLQARRSDYLQTGRKVEEQTRLAWQALLTAEERVGLLENAVNIASEVFESRKRLRESGRETAINVLDSENEVFNAQINYTSALFDARLFAYQLLLAMGRLTIDAASSEP